MRYKEVPIRVGGFVEYIRSDKKAPSGAFLSGLGNVLSIDSDKVTVDCIYAGRVTVLKSDCEGVIGGY